MNDLNNIFELCNKTWKLIISKYKDDTVATDFTDNEQVVVLVWTVTGIIENGGFEYLFESDLPGDSDFLLTIKSFEKIGCNVAKSLFQVVMKNLELTDSKLKSKREHYMTLSKEIRDKFDSEFWSTIDKITQCLAKFIRNNPI